MRLEIETLGADLEIESEVVETNTVDRAIVPMGPAGPWGRPAVLSVLPVLGFDLNPSDWTPIAWDTVLSSHEIYDHDLAADPNTFTVQENGLYRLYANVSSENTTGQRTNYAVRFVVNGTPVEGQSQSAYARKRAGHDESSTNLARIVSLSAGDTVQVHVRRIANSGSVTVDRSGTVFEVEKLTSTAQSVTEATSLSGYTESDFLRKDELSEGYIRKNSDGTISGDGTSLGEIDVNSVAADSLTIKGKSTTDFLVFTNQEDPPNQGLSYDQSRGLLLKKVNNHADYNSSGISAGVYIVADKENLAAGAFGEVLLRAESDQSTPILDLQDSSGNSLVTAPTNGDLQLGAEGKGIILTSPDGSVTKRVRLDNNGDLVVEDLA